MQTEQLQIPGIGQMKMTLAMWKNENKIFTHESWLVYEADCPWSCWNEMSSPIEFIEEYSENSMGFGDTEKEAILAFCKQEEIKPPFWW